MSQKLEEMFNEIRYSGITTAKDITTTGALSAGALSATSTTNTGTVTAKSATTDTAGGVLAFAMGNGLWGIYYGSGAPSLNAPVGSIYARTDGSSTATRIYVSSGATSWVAVTTAS